MTNEQMKKIISYSDKQLLKEELWDFVCDYLTEEMYWDLDDNQTGPTDEQIEEVKNIFNQTI
jgi:hypothetical protein